MYFTRSVLATIALGSTLLRSNAQVTTSCNPLDGVCPNDKGLATSSYSIDFTSLTELPAEWVLAQNTKVVLGKNGAELTFNKRYDAPTMYMDPKFFFGRVEYVVQAAPGTGIISSMVLLSSDLDEVDWEFRGGITDSVQTNYFGKGYTGTYNRSTTESINAPQATFHTYAIDWSPSSLTWSIDGKNVRTLNAADADGNGSRYPQTPMRVSLSLWDGGDPDTNPGTVQWAGGYTPLPSPTPFTMYVKSVKVWNAAPAQQYQYTDKSGTWTSIKIVNETMTSSSSTSMKTTQTLSLAPTTTSAANSTSPLTTTTGPVSSQNSSYPSTASGNMIAVSASAGLPTNLPAQAAGAPFPNTTRPCSTDSGMLSPTSFPNMTAASNATTLAPYLNATSSHLNATAASNATALPSAFTPSPTASPNSLLVSSPSPTPQASHPISQSLAVTSGTTADTPAAPMVSSPLSSVLSGTYVQQPPTSTSGLPTVPSQAANTPATPTVLAPSSSIVSGTYVQPPPTSTPIHPIVPSQAAAPPVYTTCTHQVSGMVVSSSPVVPNTITSTSPAAAASAVPTQHSEPGKNTSDAAKTGVPGSTVGGKSDTATSPSQTINPGTGNSSSADSDTTITIFTPSPTANPPAGPFENADDGVSIVHIIDSETSSVDVDSATTTVTTSRTTTSTVTVTAAPYPYPNGTYVSMKGSGTVASTGGFGTGSGFLPIPTGSAYLRGTAVGSGYVRGTASPLPYSTGAAFKVGMRWGMAVVAGTVTGLWSLL